MNKKNKKESHLHYISSIVLGLNDATVEMTGAIVGLTIAFSNNFIVGFLLLQQE